MYNRRNKFSPLLNTLLVAGHGTDGSAFLGTVDSIGTAYTGDFAATGMGAHLAIPVMRARYRPDLTEGQARGILEDCARLLVYRDTRMGNRVQLARVQDPAALGAAGPTLISEPYEVATRWDYKEFIKAKAGADTGGSW